MGRGEKTMLKRAAGRRKNYEDDDEDDDEYVAEEDESSYESGTPIEESFDDSDANNIASSASSAEKMSKAKLKVRRSYSSGHQRSRVSDNEWEDDDYEDDEDFSPDASEDEDFEEDSIFSGDISVSARGGAAKGRGTKLKRKLKRKVSKTKVNRRSRKVVVTQGKKKRRRMSASSEDEDNGRSAMKRRRKNPKKVSKRVGKSRLTQKSRSSFSGNSFDPDFLTTDDDLPLNVRAVRNRSRNEKKSNSRRRKISKKNSEVSDSDFDISKEDLRYDDDIEHGRVGNSSNDKRKNASTSRKQLSVGSSTGFDDGISDDKVNDMRIDRVLNLQKHEVLSAEKKGKEIEDSDLTKQLCGICLSEEHNGTIQGFLNCCSHYFCFACIMEWSKVESRCPLCKRRFVTITKFSRSGPMLEMRRHVIRVQMRDQVYQPSEEEVRVLLDPYEDVICMECHVGGDDSLMLLCDICDSSAHTYCVGLGNEVPEGNWYCDCCKLAGERSLHSQALDTREANCGVEEENCSDTQNNSIFQRSVSLQGQSSSQVFDLNALPRNFVEDSSLSASQVPGAGASTLSGRRAIRQRIRILFSNNRARQLYTEPNRPDIALHTEADRSVPEQNGEWFHPSERPNSRYSVLSNEHEPGSSRDFPHSDSNLVQEPIKRRNFRHVDGAKKQVQSMVKQCLQKLPREIPLERDKFKKIARKVTHTILASCEIHYTTSVVSSFVEPPGKCAHDLDGGPVNLLRGCCSACFADYVKNVVKMFVES